MRQLATIQKIKNIRPIPERDRISQANVLGWNVIVGNENFQEDELVIYCEIDSLFPQNDLWQDLERCKYRIKTMKVNTPDGPVYGQGYCLPLSVLEKLDSSQHNYEGKEVTDILGIVKFEPPEPADMKIGNSAGEFPTQYIPKTDEIRLASCLDVLDEIYGQECVIRQKIDGSSWTALKIDNEYVVCSRNNMIKNPEISGISSHWWDMFNKYPQLSTLLDDGYAVQAEIYGEGIQKNHLKIKGKDISIFNISNLKTRKYVDNDEFEQLIEKYHLPVCPIVYKGVFNFSYDDLEKMSDELKYDSGNPAEGIVIRPVKEQYSRVLKGRLSFKQISRVFLTGGGN